MTHRHRHQKPPQIPFQHWDRGGFFISQVWRLPPRIRPGQASESDCTTGRIDRQEGPRARALRSETGMCPLASTAAETPIQRLPSSRAANMNAATGSIAIGTGTPHNPPNSAAGVRCRTYRAHSNQYPSTDRASRTLHSGVICPAAVMAGTDKQSICPSRSVQARYAGTCASGIRDGGGRTMSRRFGSSTAALTARPIQENPMAGPYQAPGQLSRLQHRISRLKIDLSRHSLI